MDLLKGSLKVCSCLKGFKNCGFVGKYRVLVSFSKGGSKTDCPVLNETKVNIYRKTATM